MSGEDEHGEDQDKKEGLRVQIPSLGWRQILTARQEILNKYDVAREQARIRKVETLHGNVLEAAVREWLAGFLPKRYGVTSGFVVSPAISSSEKAPHFDVIIYDQLESPILWVEDNADASGQGKSMAIPVEHVRGVLEVKSSFSSGNVKEAIAHLAELRPFMEALDDPEERYKLHLPDDFFCGLLFAELRKENDYSEAALSALIDGASLRGFYGGLVLRANESGNTLASGRLAILASKEPIKSTLKEKKTPLWEMGICASRRVSDEIHLGAMTTWTEPNFSQFGFDLVALLQGTFEVGRVSSFYGMGTSTLEMMKEAGVKVVTPGDE
jgi:hypothetical protein